jgi:hypothetical protein
LGVGVETGLPERPAPPLPSPERSLALVGHPQWLHSDRVHRAGLSRSCVEVLWPPPRPVPARRLRSRARPPTEQIRAAPQPHSGVLLRQRRRARPALQRTGTCHLLFLEGGRREGAGCDLDCRCGGGFAGQLKNQQQTLGDGSTVRVNCYRKQTLLTRSEMVDQFMTSPLYREMSYMGIPISRAK